MNPWRSVHGCEVDATREHEHLGHAAQTRDKRELLRSKHASAHLSDVDSELAGGGMRRPVGA